MSPKNASGCAVIVRRLLRRSRLLVIPASDSISFLQEMNREANTIGSKSIVYEISAKVIKIREEIEKLREQVQNIE